MAEAETLSADLLRGTKGFNTTSFVFLFSPETSNWSRCISDRRKEKGIAEMPVDSCSDNWWRVGRIKFLSEKKVALILSRAVKELGSQKAGMLGGSEIRPYHHPPDVLL